MRSLPFLTLSVTLWISVFGCSSKAVPRALKVLENPTTGERVRFFREIPLKVPANYDETKHIAEWSATQAAAGFTNEITPEDDRTNLAELRKKNREASKQ